MTVPISLLSAFALNFLVAFIVVRFIYYPTNKNKNSVFTFLAFNTIIFFVLSLLASTELSVGVGFGLFAIFSMLRYRTDAMPVRDMTYLFAIIALPTINAILFKSDTMAILLLANSIIVSVLYVLERGWGFQYESTREILYDNVKMLKPENEELLLADLQGRTGLAVKRVEIGRVNLAKKTAELKIYYDETSEDNGRYLPFIEALAEIKETGS
jgi:hypothetical protein